MFSRLSDKRSEKEPGIGVTKKVKDTISDEFVYQKTKRNIWEILECTNATPILCRGGIGYTCCFCKEQFPNPAVLKEHTPEHYTNIETFNKIYKQVMGKEKSKLCIKLDITSLLCKLCDVSIDSLDELFDHLKDEHKRNIYTDIRNHILPFKFDTEHLCCCICLKEYNSFKSLLEHMNTHSTNYICNICCATFVNKAKITVHRLTHDLGEFKCSYCPKILNTKVKKMCHETSAHTNVNRMSKCGYCSEKFSSHKRKEMHLNEAHGIPLPKIEKATCKSCLREFLNKNALNAHLRRVHLREKMHRCEICDMEFFALNELKNHLLKHTGEKYFKCNVCLKSYGRRTTLREHMRIHENDRRFKCDHCGQAFVQKCSWRGHMRSKHREDV